MVILIASSAVLAGHHYNGHGSKGMGHDCMWSSWDMNEMDANQDQSLTFEEYSNRFTEKLRMGFDMIDTDKDGTISAEEWNAFLTVHGVKTSS